MKNLKFIKLISFVTALVMLFALGSVVAIADTHTDQTSLTDYDIFAEEKGWWDKGHEYDSVWIITNSEYYGQKTFGYYEGWSTGDKESNEGRTHHAKGIGMHSDWTLKPSVTYDIQKLKVTNLTTKVFLVQYDSDQSWAESDVDVSTEEYTASSVKVYFAVSKDNKTYTRLVEETLTGKGNSVNVTLTQNQLKEYKYLKFGLDTTHDVNNKKGDPTASVYFADLYIEQSEPVEKAYVPSVPARPTSAPTQLDAYEALPFPMVTYENIDGIPYGTWKAGQNDLYYLSDMIPDGIPEMAGNVILPADSNYITSSNTTPNGTKWVNGEPTTKDYPYATTPGTIFTFGALQFEYTKGIGMHPKNPVLPYKNRTDSWTLFDISEYTAEGSATPADTFYALIGLTSGTNASGSLLDCQGLYVYIYGDKVGDGQHFEFLAASNEIIEYQIGEFNVDITGVKQLLIQVIMQENATYHGYSGVGFGDACLFLSDENAQKPDYSTEEPGDEDDDSETTTDKTTTTAPVVTDATPSVTEPSDKKSGGCGSVVNSATVALFGSVFAGVVCFRKRRKEE